MGEDRVRDPLRGGARRLPRLPDLPHLRLVLCAAVGPGPAAPAHAGLSRLPGAHRASAGDRVRGRVLDLRSVRRAADGARVDRLVRRGRGRLLPAGTAVLRAGRRAVRRAARAEPLLHRESRRAGVSGHLLRRADRVGDRARGRTPAPWTGRLADARRSRALAPGRVGAERRLLAVVRVAPAWGRARSTPIKDRPASGCGTSASP